MKVFLDDDPARDSWAGPGWVIMRDAKLLIEAIRSGDVEAVSLDNDLGEGKMEGYRVIDEIEKMLHFHEIEKAPEIRVHSCNPVRRSYMNTVISRIERTYPCHGNQA